MRNKGDLDKEVEGKEKKEGRRSGFIYKQDREVIKRSL